VLSRVVSMNKNLRRGWRLMPILELTPSPLDCRSASATGGGHYFIPRERRREPASPLFPPPTSPPRESVMVHNQGCLLPPPRWRGWPAHLFSPDCPPPPPNPEPRTPNPEPPSPPRFGEAGIRRFCLEIITPRLKSS